MRLDEKLSCLGLLGFGSGWEWGHANVKPEEPLSGADGYCAKSCPEAARCMNAHRLRCQLKYPRATKHFDRMMKDRGQAEATLIWRTMHPQTPLEPYALQMVMNCEDGLEVAKTGKPKERGSHTLQWPRTKKTNP